MYFSTHLTQMATEQSSKEPLTKLYAFANDVCVMKNQWYERPKSTSGRGNWPKTKEIFRFYDGSAIGFFFEKGEPSRAEDYGAIVGK